MDLTRYFEAPHPVPHSTAPSVFIAGGITGCPDWQTDTAEALLAGHDTLRVLNPRRADFPIHDPAASPAQVRWEHDQLHTCDVTVFWFPDARPHPTVQPIALLELGAALDSGRRIVVGADPRYVRHTDVLLQCELSRPGMIVYSQLPTVIRATLEMVKAL